MQKKTHLSSSGKSPWPVLKITSPAKYKSGYRGEAGKDEAAPRNSVGEAGQSGKTGGSGRLLQAESAKSAESLKKNYGLYETG